MNIIDEQGKLRILIELDQVAFLRHWPDISAEAILPALHKARYETTAISVKLRQESRRWLESNNYGRLRGLPWPEDGRVEE